MSLGAVMRGGPLDRIHAQLNELRGINLTIARCLLQQDPADVSLTTTRIAEAAGTSRASVVRFCRRLGYAGFPEFKEAWIEQAAQQRKGRSEAAIQLPDAARRIYELAYETLTALPTLLDADSFEQTVQAMCRASLTVWCGLTGDSGSWPKAATTR